MTLSLRLKFNLFLGLASLLGIVVSWFLADHFLQQNARKEVLDSARIMLESARAVREYTVAEVRPLLELQQKRQFLPQTVPAYSARKYINKLQERYPDYGYKEATLNPTNPVDRAFGWERDIVDWFRSKPDAEELELVGERDTPTGRFMYLSQPIRVTNEACLVCHSTPANAPKTMIDSYGSANGFGWKLNEVVGAQIVSVPMSLPLQRAAAMSQIFLVSMIAVLVFIGLLLNLLLHLLVIKPVKNIADNANQVSMGVLETAELVVKGKDEISSLAQSVNRMHHSLVKASKVFSEVQDFTVFQRHPRQGEQDG
jgi:protein-histidine pros-kinase